KYAPDGTFQWVTDVGANMYGGWVAVQGTNVYASTRGGGGVARLDVVSGVVSWNTTVVSGGSTRGVAIDLSGNVDVTGNTSSAQAFLAQLDAAATSCGPRQRVAGAVAGSESPWTPPA